MYSMGKASRNVNIFSCKGQEKILLGTESPAPTVYHPNFARIQTSNPRFSMGREKRFHDECEQDMRKSVPHFYQENPDK
jgi:hypothetical protein